MRINKYLARYGYATRRGADELISRGLVTINGAPAELGAQVMEGDVVEVKNRQRRAYRYFAYNKPRGMVTHSAKGADKDIEMVVKADPLLRGTFPVGRLDKDSHGLIILTDDGRITDRLLSPEYEHEKEYMVRTARPLRQSTKEKLEAGVNIEGYLTKPAKVRITGERTFSITLTEGKKHQVRRMVVALFNEVEDLKRTRVMNIRLSNLKAGTYRPIEGEELETFLESLGLSV